MRISNFVTGGSRGSGSQSRRLAWRHILVHRIDCYEPTSLRVHPRALIAAMAPNVSRTHTNGIVLQVRHVQSVVATRLLSMRIVTLYYSLVFPKRGRESARAQCCCFIPGLCRPCSELEATPVPRYWLIESKPYPDNLTYHAPVEARLVQLRLDFTMAVVRRQKRCG